MDDLTLCLYEFLLERRMGYLWKDEEYRACNLKVRLQEERMESHLNKEQRKELDLLLDHIAERSSLEKSHLFQTTLGLARELRLRV